MNKLFVIGIDGAMPEYIFGEWLDKLPTIKKLINQGCYGELKSTIPPLSAVAWTAISTGKAPADFGFFEYIYRKNNSYNDLGIISATNIKSKTLWQIASEHNKKSIICLMPLTWPIKPFNGICVSGYMTPNTDVEFTYPKEIKNKIETIFNKQFRIISEFRNKSKEEIIKNVYENTEMHFKLMEYLLKNNDYDLFFGVIDESDSMNHNFLKYTDKEHSEYDENFQYKNVLKEYYQYIDKKLGELLNLLDKETKIIVLSDHGIIRMHNRVNLSDWLIKEGYLVLKNQITEKIKLKMNLVDWTETRAWAIGAFEGQIFVNLKNREPEGIVEEKDYDNLLNEIEEKLKKITGDRGEKLDTKVFKKKEFFKGEYEHLAPDMIIYFDNLQYGCNTSLIGNELLWSPQTAIGSDDAGHSQKGIFIMNKCEKTGDIGEVDILDIAPTILKNIGIESSNYMKGKVIS